MEEIIGYSLDEVMRKPVMYFIPEDEIQDHILQTMRRKSGLASKYERRIKTKSGKIITVIVSASPILDDRNNFIGSFAMVTDISGRISAEEELKKEKNKAELYLEISNVIFVALDKKGNITLLNKKAKNTLNCGDEEIGKNWFDNFIPENEKNKVKKLFNSIIDGDITNLNDFKNYIVSKSGRKHLILWHNTLLRDDKNDIIGTLSAGEEIIQK